MHEHVLKVQDCLASLFEMIVAYTENDRPRMVRRCRKIYRLEGQADYIKNELRRQLTRSVFSRLECADILALIRAQDDVSDRCEEAAVLLEARRTPIEPSLCEPLTELAREVSRVGAMLPPIMRLLRDNSKPNTVAEQVHDHGAEVHEAGFRTQELVRDFLKKLFAAESELDPVSVVLLMRLAETLGHVAGSAENAADCAVRIASGS